MIDLNPLLIAWIGAHAVLFGLAIGTRTLTRFFR